MSSSSPGGSSGSPSLGEPRPEDGELLSVVDEQDEVIGERRRDDVHRLGLRHRAVHVLIFDSRGRLFLQKRAARKRENPGLWDSSVAGHVDAGESYDAAIVREVQEEVGLLLSAPPQRVFKLDACESTGMEFTRVYRLVSDQPLRPNLDEIESGRWFTVEEVESLLALSPQELAPPFALIWSKWPAASARAAGAENPIVFFDGVCGLCNASVDLLVRRDQGRVLRYAPLQGETARSYLTEEQIEDLDTFYLWEEGKLLERSDAWIRVGLLVGGIWKLAWLLAAVPRPIRNGLYNLVARYRYRMFGKREVCRLPTAEETGLFLD